MERGGLCRDWLLMSIAEAGGSRAYFSPIYGWSKSYPETSGYIIPTLLDLSVRLSDDRARQAAVGLGRWLLQIQARDGYWRGGLYPYSSDAQPSVFNTAQILMGLVYLARADPSAGIWRAAARKAADWIANGVDGTGVWQSGHYRNHQPAYYTFVAWPMLEYAATFGGDRVGEAAVRVLKNALGTRAANGRFSGWGFDAGGPAFTHTIAYTLQGFLESARLLNDRVYLAGAETALERLRRAAELHNGRLPGAYADDWSADRGFECATGSAQTAICLLLWHQLDPDVRLLNAAAKLVDRVCELQCLAPWPPLRGAIPGSRPLWARYMRFRYPNWAVKFHADALAGMSDALEAAHGA